MLQNSSTHSRSKWPWRVSSKTWFALRILDRKLEADLWDTTAGGEREREKTRHWRRETRKWERGGRGLEGEVSE